MSVRPYSITIAGRHYRFKAESDLELVLQQVASELEQRITLQATQQPLASRDQLLMLTAVNVLAEMKQQQATLANLLKAIQTSTQG
ncbi:MULTISPECIES: cell division protein ZapA [Alishewanella]|jgi:cell division protein ZapA (FtsZ GTPase activity inhibitor)|uniref:Uncharacterized protein n=1 Tax=Alishewanella jeotgali KCTC 22429 TaxID=1129374 RepID=H3Z9Y0_9ALTE|nr:MULTISPECIES: cell division protein ZapA [Alishewanella]EHR42654.1 hypothetical protein AJE_00655 [Alishewanella jeotgali KCTC 22429]OCW98265.1 hypothetical protein A9165_02035 [Alishewanella sp. HH-ZS]